MWTTITFVSFAVCCLVFLPDASQGRKRVIIEVPYIIKHVHHHHIKKIHIDKYHPPKEYHFHKATYSKKLPIYYEEFDHGHDWNDFGKERYVWHKRNANWRKRNHKRRYNRVKHNYGHEEVLQGSNQVSYKTEADWREGRKENVKNETNVQQTISQEVEPKKPNTNPVLQTNELSQQLPVAVPNLNPQVLLASLLPQALPFGMPNLNFGVYPTQQNQPLPFNLNPMIFKNQRVENIQQVIGGRQNNNKPAWEANKPSWEHNKPVWEPNKPVWEANKPAWEQNKPVWEPNKPAWDQNEPVEESKNPGWETLNSWSDDTKNQKQNSPAYSYSVKVVH